MNALFELVATCSSVSCSATIGDCVATPCGFMSWSALCTGAGKSYSMLGKPDAPGIIPRTCNAIFDKIAKENDPQYEHRVDIQVPSRSPRRQGWSTTWSGGLWGPLCDHLWLMTLAANFMLPFKLALR